MQTGPPDASPAPAATPHRDAPVVMRPITPADDAAVAAIIREELARFDCTGPGTPATDPELDAMSAAYPGGDAEYLVVEIAGAVYGGGGFGRLAGTGPAQATCELRKLYLRPEVRGRGLGRALLDELLGRMAGAGYRQVYLETTGRMDVARRLYRSRGFVEIDGPLGDTGHSACDRRFLRPLGPGGDPGGGASERGRNPL